jgi:carboxyl-terminal processing protease
MVTSHFKINRTIEDIMLKKLKRLVLLLFVTASASGLAESADVMAPKAPGDKSKEQLQLIAKLTVAILSRNHYRQHKLNNEYSQKIFDEYFRMLDPSRLYFTQQDVDKFAKYRLYLDDLTIAGDTTFATKVYKLFRQRFDEYREFAEKQLKKGFDFTKKEYLMLDRSKAKRAVNMTELYDLWRKKVKNDVLYFRLMERTMKEAGKKAQSEKKKKDDKTKKPHVSWTTRNPEDKIRRRLHDIANEVDKRNALEILGIYLTAVSQVYGPHSSYMTPKQEADFNIDMKLSLVGIGALLTSEDGMTKVVKLIPGGPAEKAGELKAEDRIIAVAQESEDAINIIDMPIGKVVGYIRGKKNTKVTLTVLPGDKGINAVPKQVVILRDVVILKESEAKGKISEVTGKDGRKLKIGVITLQKFYVDFKAAFAGEPDYKSSTRDVAKILEKFKNDGVDGVIMDMRSNGGGSLMEAITLSGLFIRSGPVVQVRGANNSVDIREDPDVKIQYAGPLVVLTNKLTSSAAEIFSGAMKDYNRGILVGDSRTYGKGTVLDVYELKNLLRFMGKKFPGGTLKFETALFFRVNGSSTQKVGVKPHIFIDSITEAMKVGEEHNRHSIPWARIASAEHQDYGPDLKTTAQKLNAASSARREKNAKFKLRQRDLKIFRDYRKRKQVSLNENKRWEEYLAEKKLQEEQKKLLRDDSDKKEKTKDLLLDESLLIMRDYILMPKRAAMTDKTLAKKRW